MSRILWINPVGTDVFDNPIKDLLDRIKNETTRLDVVSFEKGPKHLEYRYYEALALPEILRTVRKAERDDYEAVIIGCFYDPGLFEARSIVERIVVTAPAEACAHLASTLGYKFSVIVTEDVCIPQMMDNFVCYGLRDKIASFKSLGLGVHDLHRDEKFASRKILEMAMEAVEKDHADVIVLGCTIQFGFCVEIQNYLKVPVIDAVSASLKYTEYLVDLKERFGWTHSKKSLYASPPISEMKEWGLEDAFRRGE